MFESFPYHDRHRCRTHITMPLETNAQVLATTFDATRRFCNLVMAESKTFDADTVFFLHVKLSFWLTVVNTCAAAYSHQSTKLKYYIHVSFLYTRPTCRQTKYIKSFHLFDFWHDALINPNVQITIACRVHACVLSTPSFGSTSSEQRTCFCFCCFIRWPTTCWHSEIDLLRKCGKKQQLCCTDRFMCNYCTDKFREINVPWHVTWDQFVQNHCVIKPPVKLILVGTQRSNLQTLNVCLFWFVFFLESSPQTTSGSRMLDPQTGSQIQHQGMYQCSRVSKHINMQNKSYHSVQLCVSLAECASWTWSCVFCFSISNEFSVHGNFVCAWTFSIYSNTKTYGVFCVLS